MSKKMAVSTLLIFAVSCSSHHSESSSFGPRPVSMEKGLDKTANATFWSAVKPVSSLPEAHYRLGRYYQKSGKHQLAINEFTKAIKLDKGSVLAYNGLGMSYDALKDCLNAQQAYSYALHYGPDIAYLYNNLGCSRLLCNDPEHAIGLFTKAAELDTSNTRIHNNLILAQLRLQQQSPENKELFGSELPAPPVGQPELPTSRKQPPQISDTASAVSQIRITPLQAVPRRPASDNLSQSENIRPADIKPTHTSVVMTSKKLVEHDGEPVIVPLGIQHAAPVLSVAPAEIKNHLDPAANQGHQGFPVCDIEVSNGNGVTGMANRSAGYFQNLGFTVSRITNAAHFNYESSRIYYQEGYLDIAKAVAGVVPGPQEFKQVVDLGRAGIGVRLLLGRDLAAIQFPEKLARKSDEQETQGKLLAMASDID